MNQPANRRHASRSSRSVSDARQPAVSGYGPDELDGVNPYAVSDSKRTDVSPSNAAPKTTLSRSEDGGHNAATTELETSAQKRPHDSRSMPEATVAKPLAESAQNDRTFRLDDAELDFAPDERTVEPSQAGRGQDSRIIDAPFSTRDALSHPSLSHDHRDDSSKGNFQTVELSLDALEALQQTVREVSLQNKQLGRQNSALFQEVLKSRREPAAEPTTLPESVGSNVQGASTAPDAGWTIVTDTDSIEVESIALPRIATDQLVFETGDWIPAYAMWPEKEGLKEGHIDAEIVGHHEGPLPVGAMLSPESKGDEDQASAASKPPVVSHRWDPPAAQTVPDPRIHLENYITATSDLDRISKQSKGATSRAPQAAELPNATDDSTPDVDSAIPSNAMPDEVDVLISDTNSPSSDAVPRMETSQDRDVDSADGEVLTPDTAHAKVSDQHGNTTETSVGVPRIQAAWEVDSFRWPEVTHRLLRDEGQSLDTVLQTLHANQSHVSRPRVVLVTGTRPSEGRSTLAISLARRAAARGQRTLLVDGDLARGQLDQAAGLEFPLGWMRPEADAGIDECLVRSLASNLFVMPQGEPSQESRPATELYRRLWDFVGRAAVGFDTVFVDTGMVEEFIDFQVPAPHLVDTALLVQGGVLGEGQSIVDAYRSLVQACIEAIAVAETFGKRMAG